MLAAVLWKAAASGNWSNPGNWSTNTVPGVNDTAVINLTGADYTVTLDGDATVAGFTLNSATATFASDFVFGRTFTVNGPATLSAGAVLWRAATWTGTGTLTNNATMTFSFKAAISSTLVQNGTLRVLGGSFDFNTPPLTVANGFTNNGTIELTSVASPGLATLTVTNGTLTNAPGGTINVLTGAGGDRIIIAPLVQPGNAHGRPGPGPLEGFHQYRHRQYRQRPHRHAPRQWGHHVHPERPRDGQRRGHAGPVRHHRHLQHVRQRRRANLSGSTGSYIPDFTTATTALTLLESTLNLPGTLTNAAGKTLNLDYATINAASVINQGTLTAQQERHQLPLDDDGRFAAAGAEQ